MKEFLKKNHAYIVIAAVFLVLLARAFYGFCWTDESFYISTADRFWRGAVPLVDEWYRTQLSSVVMLPFYAAYLAVSGSNAGVIVYFRLLYLLLSTAAALVCFKVLRKDYPDFAAVTAALFIMCYAHLNNATFSYYMLSYIFLTLSLLMIYDHKNTRSRYVLVAAGVMLALAVLSMPAFAAGYALFLFGALIWGVVSLVFGKRSFVASFNKKSGIFDIVLFTGMGAAIPAVIFLIWLLFRVGPEYITQTLPYALVDNEHTNTLGYYIRKPNRCLTEVFGNLTYVSYALIAVSFVFSKKIKDNAARFILIAADAALFAFTAYCSWGRTGYIQAAFFLFMIPVYFVSEKKNAALFWITVPAGAAVAVIYSSTSSDFLYVMAIGAAITAPAGVCAVYDLASGFIKEEGSGRIKYAAAGLLFAVCTYCLVDTYALRILNVYRDAPLGKLTVRIQEGIAKGLYTTPEHLGQYRDVCDMIDEYCSDSEGFEVISGSGHGNVLFSKILPWGYAVSGLDCGYPTTWRATAYNGSQLEKYYDVNPSAIPDIIVVLDEQYGSYDAAGDVEDDHDPNLDEMDEYWKDYIKKNGFTEKRAKCARIYSRDRQ